MIWRIEKDNDGRTTLFCETYKWWVQIGKGWVGHAPFISNFFSHIDRTYPL